MKRLINTTSMVCFVLLAFVMASCDTTNTEPSETIDPAINPTLTITSDLEGSTVTEGDTLTFNINIDKPVETAIEFEVTVGGEVSAADYKVVDPVEYKPVVPTYPAYSTETVTFLVIVPVDNIPEVSETFNLTIMDETEGTRYLISPSSQLVSTEFTVENYNNPNGLTVSFGWQNSDNDMDVFVNWVGPEGGLISYALAASADDPEVFLLGNDWDDGTYYVSINRFSYVEPIIDYTFRIGYPDHSVEIYESSFNADDPADSIILDPFTAFGIPAINLRLLQVDKVTSGGTVTFTVEHLNPSSEAAAMFKEITPRVFPLNYESSSMEVNREELLQVPLKYQN